MNKTIARYNQTQHRTLSSTDMVATLFFRCSKLMESIAENIQKRDYYARYKNSEKVIMTLTNLPTVFDEKNPDTEKLANDMKGFCMLILTYLTEINQKENVKLCADTSKLLRNMGEIWQQVE